MKLLYTHVNPMLVGNARNLVENAGITVRMKNEYAQGGIGDLSPLDAWPELWVDEADYDRAMQIISTFSVSSDSMSWVCNECGEENDASFEYCWNCRQEQP